VRRLYLQLGRVAGVPPNQPDMIGPIQIDEADRLGAHRALSQTPEWQIAKPYIVINPNASDLLLERRWPDAYVIETITRLMSLGHQVVLIGAKNERAYVQTLMDRLSSELRQRVANIAGLLTLGELFAVLDRSACILTNDSGPMHMAIALERPTVCLFGPASPEHYGQELPNVTIFYDQVFCSPCLYEADQPPCNGNNVCMQRIKPGRVIESVLRLARGEHVVGRRLEAVAPCPAIGEAPDGTPLGVVIRASLIRSR